MPMRDSSFLKVAHRTQCRAEGGAGKHVDGPGYPNQGGHPKSEIAKIKML